MAGRICLLAAAMSSRSPSRAAAIDQYNTVFHNQGARGKWRALTEEAGLNQAPPARHRGCAFGDFDGDGRVDAVVTALSTDAEIWMNRSEKSGHWLDIALRGSKSNRDGIGARIKLVSRSGTQYNHMTTSVGYASSSDGPVHFGLGPDSRADSIEIQWPSGVIQTLTNVASDAIVKVENLRANLPKVWPDPVPAAPRSVDRRSYAPWRRR